MEARKKYIAEITNYNGVDEENFEGCFVVPFEITVSQAFWFFAYCHNDYVKQSEISPIKGSLHFGGIVKSIDYMGSDINVATSSGGYRFICAGVI